MVDELFAGGVSVPPSTAPKLADSESVGSSAGWGTGVATGAGATAFFSGTATAGKLVVLAGWPIPRIK